MSTETNFPDLGAAPPSRWRARLARALAALRARDIALILLAGSGWALAIYEKLIDEPAEVAQQRMAYTVEIVDRFAESEASRAYKELSAELNPWWEQIRPLQLKIMASKDEREKQALIDQRDESLLAFIHEHKLESRIDMLIAAFERFNRCLVVETCDEDLVRRAIAIDVKRIYRTFRPYIVAQRQEKPANGSFGRDLEDLFFRFLFDASSALRAPEPSAAVAIQGA